MRLFCTLAAIVIALATLGQAWVAPASQQIDQTVTGSIGRTITPATYGLRFRPDVGGY